MKADVGRVFAIGITLVAVAAATGCGGSKKNTGAPSPPTTPTTTTVTTVRRPVRSPRSISSTSSARHPKGTSEERATVRAFRQAGFKRIYQRSFNGAFNVTDATTYLFGSAAGG